MRNKILWLSILGLALAKPPNPIDPTLSNVFNGEQKQRSSRSIWPFTSSATTTEPPETYPPLLPDNNEWFVQGETPLPQGIDLNKYPIWKVHKYNGIDLHPVNLKPQNYYPPEETIVGSGYPSGSNLPPDFPPNSYLNGYQDFLNSRSHTDKNSQPVSGSYSAGYPPAVHPFGEENYRTGEYHGSSITPGINQYNIQTQEKHEVYVPPESLTNFRSTVIPGAAKVPQYNYGSPNAYRQPVNADYHRHQEQIQTGQRQELITGEEQNSAIQSQSSDGKEPDLSLLDQLSALNTFFPGDETENSESSSSNDESSTAQQGFFENLLSRFQGTTETAVPASEAITSEIEETPQPGGFLSSMFGLSSGSIQAPEDGSSVNTAPSENVFSSLFYQPETERPAVVLPTTYYLPKTRGSYIAVKIPATNTAPGYGPTLGPFDDLSKIGFNDVPKVPFTQYEIPQISGPTLDSGYPYNPDYLDARSSAVAGSAANGDYPPYGGSGQPHPDPTEGESYLTRQQSGYQGPDDHRVNGNFPRFSSSSNNAEALDMPRAEYLHSSANDGNRANASPSPSTSQSSHYREEQSVAQSDGQTPVGYPNALSSSSVNDFTQSRNKNTQSLSRAEGQYQNSETTNSNFGSPSSIGETVERGKEIATIVNRGNEPISATKSSSDSIPTLSYGIPGKRLEQVNFENLNEENNGQNGRHGNSGDNFSDFLTQNSEDSSPALNEDLVQPVQTQPSQSSVPVYQTSISALQTPTAPPISQKDIDRFLPVNEAVDFHQRFYPSEDELENNRFVENLSSLTSIGTPTNTLQADSLAAASSNVRVIAVYPSTSDKAADDLDVTVNRDDAFRSTSPERLFETKEGDRVGLRNVMKRWNPLEGNNNWQRSYPVRQAPADETEASSIIRSDIDSLPEMRGGRKFDETNIIAGYSKVQHPQHQYFQTDNDQAIKPVNPELETV